MLQSLFGLLRKLFLFVITIALVAALTVALITVGYSHHLYKEAVEAKPVSQAMGDIQAQADYTPLEQIPGIYVNAVVATEDQRFFTHKGYDVIGTTRALLSNMFSDSITQGGSTITQQLARSIYFSQEQTITRKIAEIFAARAIEQQYSKNDILTAYMNSIYYGDGYYSIAQASWGYFGVAPAYMTSYQCTLLAGVPNAPSVYAPTQNPDLAAKRQLVVLRSMINERYLTQDQANAIVGYNAF